MHTLTYRIGTEVVLPQTRLKQLFADFLSCLVLPFKVSNIWNNNSFRNKALPAEKTTNNSYSAIANNVCSSNRLALRDSVIFFAYQIRQLGLTIFSKNSLSASTSVSFSTNCRKLSEHSCYSAKVCRNFAVLRTAMPCLKRAKALRAPLAGIVCSPFRANNAWSGVNNTLTDVTDALTDVTDYTSGSARSNGYQAGTNFKDDMIAGAIAIFVSRTTNIPRSFSISLVRKVVITISSDSFKTAHSIGKSGRQKLSGYWSAETLPRDQEKKNRVKSHYTKFIEQLKRNFALSYVSQIWQTGFRYSAKRQSDEASTGTNELGCIGLTQPEVPALVAPSRFTGQWLQGGLNNFDQHSSLMSALLTFNSAHVPLPPTVRRALNASSNEDNPCLVVNDFKVEANKYSQSKLSGSAQGGDALISWII